MSALKYKPAPSAPTQNVASLGQVFTPSWVVKAMLALRRNSGRVLEPSCGAGAFADFLPAIERVALELDARHAPDYARCMDFFNLPIREKFASIVGNPPYVRYQDILPSTRARLHSQLFDARSNLYLFFIEKSVRHLLPGGELIFITPRDFLKTTSSIRLNRWLYAEGTMTHVIDLGDNKIFSHAIPNCLIWRFEKNNYSREIKYCAFGFGQEGSVRELLQSPPWQKRYFIENAGHFMFARRQYPFNLRQIASVKVGAVSGADQVFHQEVPGARDFVCSSTIKNGQTRRMLWSHEAENPPSVLLPYKQQLLARKIRSFDESNWWHWGRAYPQSTSPRLYVNGKTRQKNPFFCHPCTAFDGSVLAIFPHQEVDLQQLCAALNRVDWDDLGFVCNGRFLFTQRSLQNTPLPDFFAPFGENINGAAEVGGVGDAAKVNEGGAGQ